MFSGIVEDTAVVVAVEKDKGNIDLTLRCPFTSELKVDQSISHNGVCLTVVRIDGDTYTVTAMKETLERSNLGLLQVGDNVNVERSMLMNGRLDGHIVQGHVDMTAECVAINDADGSTYFTFEYQFDKEGGSLTLGYQISLGSRKIFHSGDTVVTRELIQKLQKAQGIDAAMLPINGRDLERNEQDIVGNMNSREACWFASEIKADLTIPLHYDMIGGNEENPLVFADYMERYYPEKKYHIFRLGERYIL